MYREFYANDQQNHFELRKSLYSNISSNYAILRIHFSLFNSHEESLKNFFISVSLFLSSKKPQIMGYFRGCLYESRYIGQGIYRLANITFSMLLYERRKVITHFRQTVYLSALFLQKTGYGNNELLKKCSCEGLNFICSN